MKIAKQIAKEVRMKKIKNNLIDISICVVIGLMLAMFIKVII